MLLEESGSGIPDFPFSSITHRDELVLDPIAHQLPLTPEQTLRQSASDLHLEEQDASPPSGRRDRDTLLRSPTNHEVWEVFTLR